MDDLWRRLAQNEAFSTFPLVQYATEQLPHGSFSSAFAVAVERVEREGILLPADRRLLIEFGDGCGRTDLVGQQAHIAYYRNLLAQQEEEARRAYEEKGRVYRMLGLTGGVALMLLLM